MALSPGDELPRFVRETTGFHHWNRYAAVNDEYAIIHMDDDAGREAGYASAFGMGNLQWAYLHNLLRQWLGEDGRILSIACQFRGANMKGQTVTAHGRVEAVHDAPDGTRVELEVWTQSQSGQRLAVGRALVVRYPRVGG
jgi:hypothetical protein